MMRSRFKARAQVPNQTSQFDLLIPPGFALEA